MCRVDQVVDLVLQILVVKSVTNDDKGKRHRFLISDGKYSCQLCIMLGHDNLVEMLESGKLEKFGIICLKKYAINKASDKTVLIIMEPECLVKGSDVERKIGDPLSWDLSGKKLQCTSSVSQSVSSIEKKHQKRDVNQFKLILFDNLYFLLSNSKIRSPIPIYSILFFSYQSFYKLEELSFGSTQFFV